MTNLLSGYRTYIIGWVLLLKGVAGFFFPDTGISTDPAQDIELGMVALGLRAAIK